LAATKQMNRRRKKPKKALMPESYPRAPEECKGRGGA
jgi:hypothetical protein